MTVWPQWPQDAQWPPAQPPHPGLPWLLVTNRLLPFSLLIAAQADMTRRAPRSAHRGQAIGESDSLISLSASNRARQLTHWYSYNGIEPSLGRGFITFGPHSTTF
jgi:hypothetical protein